MLLFSVLVAAAAAQTWPNFIPSVDWKQELAWDMSIAAGNVSYSPNMLGWRYVVGGGAQLPPEVEIELSNNCVGIISFNNTLFMGFRTAPFHFASNLTKMYILSSVDGGFNWTFEHLIQMGSDVREPHFLIMNNQLIFSFFQAGTDPLAFEPQFLFHMTRSAAGVWSDYTTWGQPGEIAWQIGVNNGTAYAASYLGNHYSLTNRPNISVYFNESVDGINWKPTNPDSPIVYSGGVSEVGWAFDLSGTMYAVLRNEDGDDSGWGSRVAVGTPSDPAAWSLYPQNQSNPYIYESSRMFRHGDDLFLVARRDPNAPYWNQNISDLPWMLQHDLNLAGYSLRSHRTSLFRVSQDSNDVELLYDIPGCGDTAFPSIVRVSEHTYIIVNYSNPFELCPDWPWIEGQISSSGSQLYFLLLQFEPSS